jgi:pimeloyl-ACP methyl ester carboxylesterase
MKNESARRLRLSSGTVLCYAEYGDPAGVPLMYFHGGLSCRLDIRDAAGDFAIAGVRVIAPDRPGIGGSEYVKNRTLLEWPLTVSELADALEIDRFATLGWSAGGPYSIACARMMPQRLTYAATAGGMAPLNGSADVRELGLMVDRVLFPLVSKAPALACAVLQLTRITPPSVMLWFLIRESHSPSDRSMIQSSWASDGFRTIREALKSGVHGTLRDYRLVGEYWGFELGQVTFSIDLWQGEEDRLLPITHARRLANSLPNAHLRCLPRCGHFLMSLYLGPIIQEVVNRAK